MASLDPPPPTSLSRGPLPRRGRRPPVQLPGGRAAAHADAAGRGPRVRHRRGGGVPAVPRPHRPRLGPPPLCAVCGLGGLALGSPQGLSGRTRGLEGGVSVFTPSKGVWNGPLPGDTAQLQFIIVAKLRKNTFFLFIFGVKLCKDWRIGPFLEQKKSVSIFRWAVTHSCPPYFQLGKRVSSCPVPPAGIDIPPLAPPAPARLGAPVTSIGSSATTSTLPASQPMAGC